jgi:hypothetical protein
MLAAAFILAIGILGILMLQMIAIRATRGTSNMGTAARIAGQIIDQAEMEGRLSRLNITDGNRAAPTLGDLAGFQLKYIVIEAGKQLVEEYNLKGDQVDKDNTDLMASTAFFTVATRRENIETLGASNPVGAISDFQVRVTFSDEVGVDKQIITRTFNLSRRIIHG